MAISHCYYLFYQKNAQQVLSPEFLLLNDYPESYTLLCSHGMELFDGCKKTQAFADRYGGWDRASIITTFTNKPNVELDDYAFWYSLFLYSQLEESPELVSYGLGTGWESAHSYLQHEGVLETDRENIIMGNGLESLALEWLPSFSLTSFAKGQYIQIWQRFRPFSTSSHAGWLGNSAIHSIIGRLSKLPDARFRQTSAGLDYVECIVKTLRFAISRSEDLIILISG